MNQNQYQNQQEGAPTPRSLTAQNAQLARQNYGSESSAELGARANSLTAQNAQMSQQNYGFETSAQLGYQSQNGAPTSRSLTAQNAQMARQNYGSENASELAQSQGEISRLLLAKAKQGFEFGNLGAGANYNAYQANNSAFQQQQGLEVDQSAGQVSQILSQQSRQ